MGQPISVVRKPTTAPAFVRFEINRTLTGTGHERYRAGTPISGERPPDELARRLFDHGGITAVHIHSNIVDVELAAGGTSDGMEDIIRELYIHYKPGVVPWSPAP